MPQAAAEIVTFPGDDITIEAPLFRPSGPGPFPAVIALHGCGGLYGKNGDLSPRHKDWAERLQAQGFLVLMPDSFGSRGEGSQCRERARVARASSERIDDVLAAKAYLQSRSDVKADAVSLLGWSNGGSTVLYTLREIAGMQDGKPPFAKAIAFYPGCRSPLQKGGWKTATPLLILIGEADDWTPMQPCKDLAEQASRTGSAPVSIVTYPGAYHDFDHPSLKVHSNEDLAYTGSGSGSAHSGTDPAAREDALKRVPEFLAR
ncbi:MAG TPA: dienelactone hydrolase family protein [Hyphomicrobiales bacterium]